MKNLDEENKLLREKIEESVFEYKEEYWKEAEQLLQLKRRRRFGFWWVSIFILMLLSAGGIYFMSNIENRNENIVTINNASQQNNKPFTVNQNEKTEDELKDKAKNVPSSVNSVPENNSSPVSENHSTVKSKSSSNQPVSNNISRKENEQLPSVSVSATQKESESNTTGTDTQEKSIIPKEKIEENPATDIVTEKTVEVVAETVLNTDAVKQPDTIATVTTQPETEHTKSLTPNPLPQVIFREQFISVIGGANLNKGINASGSRVFSLGVVPFIGAEYSRAIDRQNKKMLGLGLQLCILNKLNSQTEIHHSNYFSFGYGAPNIDSDLPLQPVSDTVFTLRQKALYTLQLPVVFTYAVTDNHRIRAGVGVSYMIDGYGDVLNFDGTESKSFGYTHGYNPLNVFVQAGYIYRIGNKWSIGLSIQQGLTDMTDNSFFQSNEKDLNTNVLLGLRREITLKSKKNVYVVN